MCGINGIIFKNCEPSTETINIMNEAIKHRGPDGSGIYKFKNCIIGHQRLSIQDLSKKGHQPMSVDGRYWIIFNGEIYNFKTIRQDLEALGYSFYSDTDTEVILNAYKEWGIKSFSKFNGMWCFAILDAKANKLIISRDRYGVKPCYYYFKNNKFVFSSEIKGIFASNIDLKLDEKKCLRNPKELEGYFTTIYKDIDIVPPGSVLEINLGNFEFSKKRWWKGLDNIPEVSPNYYKAREILKEKLLDATRIRLISDAKIALSLSGGIDSSTIFSIINTLSDKQNVDLNPFVVKDNNIVFDNAIELCNLYKTKMQVVKNHSSPFDDIKSNLATIELPMIYNDQIDLYKTQKEQGFKVSIDGHGADEALGGYLKDIKFFSVDYHNNIANTYKTIMNISDIDDLKDIIKKYNYVNSINEFNEGVFSKLFLNRETIKNQFVTDELLSFSNEPLISDFLLDDLNELEGFPLSFQVLYFNANFGHLQWLLNKWDKASMAHSIEIRCPFLDWNFFQYALSLPSNFKIKNGMNKFILRDAFTDIIPQTVYTDKRKQGLSKNLNIVEKRNFLLELSTESNFINSDLWDGEKIRDNLNNDNFLLLENNIKDLWTLATLYCLDDGLKEKNKNLTSTDAECKYNLLNKQVSSYNAA